MDIKEIAERVSKRIYVEDGLLLSKFISEKFAEALIAELAKQNNPVAWARYPKFTGSTQRQDVVFKKPDDLHNWVYLYTLPPTAEQSANETAEACAKYVNRFLNGDGIQDEAWIRDIESGIRRGTWKEFK